VRRFPIIASVALACALSMAAATPRPSPQTTQTTTTATPSKPVSHKKKHHASKREPSQKAPTADRISEIQSALVRGGYYQGNPNGKWDANTVAAVQKFQSANGIEANGKLDAPTLQKLGLGSGIAGVSAPKPAPPPSGQTSTPPTAGPIASANPSSDGSTSVSKPSEH